MSTFEITIQRRAGDEWPVVVEHGSSDTPLAVRVEGVLQLDQTELLEQRKPKDYGTLLGRALFRDDVRDAFVRAIPTGPEWLHVLLFVEAPDLRELRWERLCAPFAGTWDFLALDQRVPFSLYLPSPVPADFRPIGSRDLRALLVAASPEGLDQHDLKHFDVAAAVSSVRLALGEIPCDVLATIDDAIGPPTLDQLCTRITAGSYTLLHVVCHGRFKRSDGETSLYLADEANRVDRVTASRLIERLRPLRGAHGLARFAFLATCESAHPTAEGALGGLAQRLVRDLGMPALVAMTDRVSVPTARALAEEFYRRLRAHGFVDRALVEAYAGVAGRYDVTVPALYSRLGAHSLFSDALDRELTSAEVEFGLSRLRALLSGRAPVLEAELNAHVATLRGMLGADPAALSAPAHGERDEALAEVNKLCEEALELSFSALALGQTPPAYDARVPFRGLYPFRPEDREFFFGRDALVEALRRKLAEHHFLPVLGPSGCGKSSLILAGLIPKVLEQEPTLRLAYLTPGARPVAQLEASLASPGDRPAIVIVDQFEEVFTLCRDEAERRAFLDRLLELAGRMRVVVTMRADFWGECAPYPALKEVMQARQELIAPMDAAELRRAMERQAGQVGLRFEADLGNTLLDDVLGEPGAMPLLQHALLELWHRRHGRWLRTTEYRAIGGVQQAIACTADGVYEGLTPDEQDRVRDIFVRLTRLDEDAAPGEAWRDTRRRLALEELVPAGSDPIATTALVKRLADARLVVTTVNDSTNREEVDVAHEALIRYWTELRRWLEEDRAILRRREGVRRAAREWEENAREESYLVHTGRRLEDARVLLGHPRVSLNRLELAYLETCVALRDRARARPGDPARDYQTVEIRIFGGTEPDSYPVELRVPNERQFSGRLELDRDRLPMRWLDPESFGRTLGEMLFANGALGGAYREAVALAEIRGSGLRLRLQLDPPELQSIPWEGMYHPVDGDWRPVALTGTTMFSRYVPSSRWQNRTDVTTLPLRILAVIASPANLDQYDLVTIPSESRQALHATLDRLSNVRVTYLESGTANPPTLRRIQRELGDGHHLVHFLCHARTIRDDTVIYLEGDDGTVEGAWARDLLTRFRTLTRPPRFCFLDGVETLPLGQKLVTDCGVQAAIAMSGLVSIQTLEEFTDQFYARLLEHGVVDLAVSEARALVQDRPDWSKPVLFSQLPDNQLIDPLHLPAVDEAAGRSQVSAVVERESKKGGVRTP